MQKTDSQIYRDTMLKVTTGALSTAQNVAGLVLENPNVGYDLNISGEVRQNSDDLSKTNTTLQDSMHLYLLSDEGELIFYKGSTNRVNIASVDLAANSINFTRPERLFGFEVLTEEEKVYGRKEILTEDVLKLYDDVLVEFDATFTGQIISK